MMLNLAENWWAIALRGLAGIAFGVLAFLLPEAALAALILLFGAYALVDGVFAIMAGVRGDGTRGRNWLLAIFGVIGVLAGIFTFLSPGITALVLLTYIGVWSIFRGGFEIAAAWSLRKEIEGEWWLALDGVLAIAFGLFVIAFPGAGALALVWLIAAIAIVQGIMLLALAFRLRARHRHATGTDVPRGSAAAAA